MPDGGVFQGFFASTAFQRVISDSRKAPNSSGELGLTTRPMSSMRYLISALLSARANSPFSFMTPSRGVPAGANSRMRIFIFVFLLCIDTIPTFAASARGGKEMLETISGKRESMAILGSGG